MKKGWAIAQPFSDLEIPLTPNPAQTSNIFFVKRLLCKRFTKNILEVCGLSFILFLKPLILRAHRARKIKGFRKRMKTLNE